jgi:hypothetical protein
MRFPAKKVKIRAVSMGKAIRLLPALAFGALALACRIGHLPSDGACLTGRIQYTAGLC